MIVQIICNEEEYKNTLKPLIPNGIKIVKSINTARDGRLLFVKNNLSFPIHKECLFRRLKRKGYVFGRATLGRDLKYLEADDVCKLVITNGGSEGCFTKIIRGDKK